MVTTPQIQTLNLSGVDISHWQGSIRWEAVKSAGTVFTYIKATQGLSFVDSLFASNLASANSAGLRSGSYHFLDPEVEGWKQAEHFLETAKPKAGDLCPAVNVEISGPAVEDALSSFLERVEEASGLRPIIYASVAWWNENISANFGDYPLWVAEWGQSSPTLPHGWDTWTLWQHSDTGSVDGIDGDVDLDYFNSALGDLDTLLIR